MLKKLAFYGYYGVGNFGDDLMLYYLVKNIFERIPEVEIAIFYGKDGTTEFLTNLFLNDRRIRYYEIDSLKNFFRLIRSFDALIFGGGTCFHEGGSGGLPYFLLARLLGVYTIYLGVGIGKFSSLKGRYKSQAALLFSNVAAFRDNASLDVAQHFLPKRKKNLFGTGDLIYLGSSDFQKQGLVSRGRDRNSNSKTLLVSWREFQPWEVNPQYTNVLLEHLCKGLKTLCDEQKINTIRLMSLCDLVDNRIHTVLKKQLELYLKDSKIDVKITHEKEHAEKLSEIANAYIFISARLHGLIMGKMIEIPTIGFNYSPKVEAFAKEIGQNCILYPSELLEDPNVIKRRVAESRQTNRINASGLEKMQKRAFKNIDLLFDLLHH